MRGVRPSSCHDARPDPGLPRLRLTEPGERENGTTGREADGAERPCFQQVAPSDGLITRSFFRAILLLPVEAVQL